MTADAKKMLRLKSTHFSVYRTDYKLFSAADLTVCANCVNVNNKWNLLAHDNLV